MPSLVLHAEAASQVAALLPVPPRGLVRWRDLRPVLEVILRHLRTDISAEGLRLKALPDGVHIEAGTGSASVMRHAHLPLHQELRMQPDRRIAGWRTLAPMLQSIARCLPFQFSVDGLTLHQIPGGIHLGAGGAGAASVTHQAQARELLRGLPDRGMVGWSRLTPPLKRLTAALVLKVDAEGMEASATVHGIHLAAEVCVPPVIEDVTGDAAEVAEGAPYSLTCVATGSAPLNYEWKRQIPPDLDYYTVQNGGSDTWSDTASFGVATLMRFLVTVTNACGSDTAAGTVNKA